MKIVLVLFIGVLTVCSFSYLPGEDEEIDKGIGGIKINAELKNIKSFLKPLAKDKMWSKLYDENMITTVYLVDMTKFPEKKFLGLTIDRIEIQFQTHVDSEGEEQGEDVFEFMLFCKAPQTAVHDKLINDAMMKYGDIRTYSIDENDNDSPNWFTHVTLMTIAGKKAYKAVASKKYLWVNYRQGYGG